MTPSVTSVESFEQFWRKIRQIWRICEPCNDYYRNKLILTNTKNQKNGEIYKKVLVEPAVRNEEVPFDHVQLRTKFKKAIAECKKTSLTMKTSTGIEIY